MTQAYATPTRHRTAIRVALGVVAAIQLFDGVYALLAPVSFYEDFPLGRGWVEALPGYNEHLVRDVGGLFLATGAFHLFNLGPYDTADVIGNVVGLLATVVLPLWVLVELYRQRG